MVIGLSIHTFTIAHVVISLVAIASGLIVLFGIWDVGGASLASLDRTMSGDHDSHQRYRIYVSDSQLYSRARRRRCFDVGVGSRADCSMWRRIYVATAVSALYFNVLVLIVQSFQKVPTLNTLAPTQAKPSFLIAQGVALMAFLFVGIAAVFIFRPAPAILTYWHRSE